MRVIRPRLLADLNRGLKFPLILVSSLPGSGKTTALTEWINQLSIPAAWLSLDENDNDTSRFFRYFIAALQSIFPEVGKSAFEELDSTEVFAHETILTSLINELCKQNTEFVLVLDDFHVIQSQPIQTAIAYFLDHQPPQAHLVIATRADPHLSLSQLRARNKILELRMDDLRFTGIEIHEYLNQVMGLNLSGDELVALETRTEGWIASLQLAALSLKHTPDRKAFIRAFSGSNRYVMDYLVEEVLDLQPDKVLIFLLQTSILERLNGPLCDAVCSADRIGDEQTGFDLDPGGQGQEMLEFLERSNLFIIPLDEERKWYRYHHLFASLLRARLVHSKIAPIKTLHFRAVDWFEQNGYPEDAIRHALIAQDYERAANLVERIAETEWLNGQYSKITDWIQTLPKGLALNKPWLCIWMAWSFTQIGSVKEANAWIEAAGVTAQKYTQARSGGQAGSQEQHELSYQIAALRVMAACLEQDYDRAVRLAAEVLENPIPQEIKSSRFALCHIYHGLSYKYYTDGNFVKAEHANLETIRLSKEIGFTLRQLHGTNKLAYVYKTTGRLQHCYRLIQNTLADLKERGLAGYFAIEAMHCRLVDLLYEWDQIEEATAIIENHLKPELMGDVPYLLVDYYTICARQLILEKDLMGAQTLLDKASILIHQSYIWPGLTWQTEALQVRLWLLAGDLSAATAWALALPPIPSGGLAFSIESREICRARVLLATGNYPGAIDLLNQLESAAKAGERRGSLVMIDTLSAVAFLRAGLMDLAITALERALSLAEPEGYTRTIIDEGQPIAGLLAHIIRKQRENHPPLSTFARRLLEKIEVENKENTVQTTDLILIEALSRRELEVLRCMAAGLTNLETARQLVIETTTVKRHINSIFAKLGVNNRVQAVNIARTNKII